jgi:hypothetical protein
MRIFCRTVHAYAVLDVPIHIFTTEFCLINDFIQGIKYTVKHISLNATPKYKFITATNFVLMGNPLLEDKQMDV